VSFTLNEVAVCSKPITRAQTGTTKHGAIVRIFTTEDLGISGKIILKWISSRFEGSELD